MCIVNNTGLLSDVPHSYCTTPDSTSGSNTKKKVNHTPVSLTFCLGSKMKEKKSISSNMQWPSLLQLFDSDQAKVVSTQ